MSGELSKLPRSLWADVIEPRRKVMQRDSRQCSGIVSAWKNHGGEHGQPHGSRRSRPGPGAGATADELKAVRAVLRALQHVCS